MMKNMVVSHFSKDHFSNNNFIGVRVILRGKLGFMAGVRVGEMGDNQRI